MRIILKTFFILTFTFGMGALYSFESCCGCQNAFDGFYLGVGGGVVTTKGDAKITATVVTDVEMLGINSDIATGSKGKICDTGPWGEIYGGWGMQCSCFYFGGRVGVNFSSADFDLDDFSSVDNQNFPFESVLLSSRLKGSLRTTEWTLDFKPGLVVCERTLIFATLGAAFNQQELCGLSDLSAGLVDNTLLLEKKKSSTGFRGGLGIEHPLFRCLYLQASYVYTCYKDLKVSKEQDIGPGPHTAFAKTSMHREVTSLGLSYYF